MVRDKVKDKVIKLFYTPTHTQLADLLTKALDAQQLASLLVKMSIINIHGPKANLEGGCKAPSKLVFNLPGSCGFHTT